MAGAIFGGNCRNFDHLSLRWNPLVALLLSFDLIITGDITIHLL